MSVKAANDQIEIYMGPQELGAPDNLKDTIVNFIGGATKTLDIAVQEVDCRDIADALIAARKKNVRVRIVLEADYLIAKKRQSAPWTPGGSHEPNREIHNALLRSKAWVRSDFNPDIFHQKFIIRDRSSVLTGSTNFTDTGVTKNLNHLVIVHDDRVVKAYQREFNDIRKGRFGKQGQTPAKPPEILIHGVRVKPLFAPDHNPEMEIMKQMAKAQKSIDFAIFTFSKSSGIDDQMKKVGQAGIKIRGAMDGGMANQSWAASHSLIGAQNISLWRVDKTAKLGKLHHKLMVLDGRVVVIGSFNYTGPANVTNDENIMIIGDLECPDPTITAEEEKIGACALKEIDRIREDHGKKL